MGKPGRRSSRERTIADVVLDFCRWQQRHRAFSARELYAFVVTRNRAISCESATRVLRRLRQKGVVSYRCVNRNASLYRLGRAA